jgi:hypothetical protein
MNRGSKDAWRALIIEMFSNSIALSFEGCDDEMGSKAAFDTAYEATCIAMVFSNSIAISLDDDSNIEMSRVERGVSVDLDIVDVATCIAMMLSNSEPTSLDDCNEEMSRVDRDSGATCFATVFPTFSTTSFEDRDDIMSRVAGGSELESNSMGFPILLKTSGDDRDDIISRIERCSEADMHFVHGNRPKSPSALSSFIDIKLPNSKIVSLGDDETSRVKRGSKVDLDNVYGVTSLVDPPPNS